MNPDKTKHIPRKRFGQNFLNNQQIIQKIISVINPLENDCMVEIGPGQGALTRVMLDNVRKLYAVEIDRDLVELLTEEYASSGKLILYSADALKFDFASLFSDKQKLRIFGNLPYNISTPLLFHLFDSLPLIQDMYFMLQEEVVDRLIGQPNTKRYGRLSVMAQYFCTIKKLFVIPPGAFYPIPKVNSAIVKLQPHAENQLLVSDMPHFKLLVTTAFNHRRKTLRNSLKTFVTAEQWNELELDATKRAEELSVSDFVRLANCNDS